MEIIKGESAASEGMHGLPILRVAGAAERCGLREGPCLQYR